MKKILLGCATAVFSASVANATDLPARAPNIYKATPAYSWSGLYGGISGGYAWGENKIDDDGIAGGSNKYKPAGGFGGVQIGYNNQFSPHWLIGAEIDISGGKIDDDLNPAPGVRGKNEFNAFGTARTRFGYVQDRWLVYLTGGAIWLRDKYKAASGIPITDATQYRVGWVFGGGLEYAVDQRWSWKLEYLYAPLDRSHNAIAGTNISWDPSFSLVRVGLNYKFADGASANYMPVKAAAPRSNWSGSYVGLHGGYGWGDLDTVRTGAAGAGNASLKPEGGYGGFQGGYNWLYAPNALIGIEIDSSFGDLKDSAPMAGGVGTLTSKIEDLGTARLRLGYLMTPDSLFYVTGGAAYAREKSTSASVPAVNTKADHLGWTLGAGFEYMFAPQWSLKAEYLYADLGSFKDNDQLNAVVTKSDLTLNTVRVGINYYGSLIERFFNGR